MFPDHLALRWLHCKHALERGEGESVRSELEALAAIDPDNSAIHGCLTTRSCSLMPPARAWRFAISAPAASATRRTGIAERRRPLQIRAPARSKRNWPTPRRRQGQCDARRSTSATEPAFRHLAAATPKEADMAQRGSAAASLAVAQRQRRRRKGKIELVGDEQGLPQPIRRAGTLERASAWSRPAAWRNSSSGASSWNRRLACTAQLDSISRICRRSAWVMMALHPGGEISAPILENSHKPLIASMRLAWPRSAS